MLYKNLVLKLISCFLLILQLSSYSYAQLRLSLEETIELAHKQSVDAIEVRNNYENSHMLYRNYVTANYLPRISLDATFPNLNRSISAITMTDGSEEFVTRNLINYNAGLTLNQPIPFTGGQLFIRSDLQRLDIIEPHPSITYQSSPIVIGLRQPLSTFNRNAWNRKIEPLIYKESRHSYYEQLEDITLKTVNLFFDFYLSQINLEIAKNNLANNDTIFQIARGRYNLGRIAENELLQMELSLLNAQVALGRAELDFNNNKYNLLSFLRLPVNEEIELIMTEEISIIEVDPVLALNYAMKNSSKLTGIERQLLESEMQLKQVKSESMFNADLFALYGLNQSAQSIPEVYDSPLDQQQFRVGIQVPIMNWGQNIRQRNIAENNHQIMQARLEIQKENFEHQIQQSVLEFKVKEKQLEIALKAGEVAEKRFEVSRQRYLIGKIGITDLNLAMNEQDLALRSVVSALRSYWTDYFNLRKLTLYDFENKREIFSE